MLKMQSSARRKAYITAMKLLMGGKKSRINYNKLVKLYERTK